jgi:hypothetical protein
VEEEEEVVWLSQTSSATPFSVVITRIGAMEYGAVLERHHALSIGAQVFSTEHGDLTWQHAAPEHMAP